MRVNKKIFILFLILSCFVSVEGARIKDIVDIKGIRSNPLSGFGLVVGLADGNGDSSLPSRQMLSSLLNKEGMNFSPDSLGQGSVALVVVTAELGPWDRQGSRIDITVSAIGDAKSLEGGVLLATELRGLDGEVYAVARASSISTASWNVESDATGTKARKNHPTVGRIPNGAHVERSEISDFVEILGGMKFITLSLRNSDFSTAERIRKAVDSLYPNTAFVEDAGTIRVRIPTTVSRENIVRFIDSITEQQVRVDMPAIVVINERTGTIVAGGNVGISEAAVAQGSLVVKVKERLIPSQPQAPFSEAGQTVVVPDTEIEVSEEGHLIPVPNVVTVEELANSLNAIGATPRDLIAIFNALKVAGALQAKIEMM